ncbi:putative transcriptional regulator [Bacillus sp. TS-2]|nr:putative transcriptional regulator [Bacillus sp. TS-2]
MKFKRLAELRKSHNLNQDQVADILNVHRNTYTNYELGEREMNYVSLIKLADYYKVSVDYILERTDDPFLNNLHTTDEIEFMERSLELYKEMKRKL